MTHVRYNMYFNIFIFRTSSMYNTHILFLLSVLLDDINISLTRIIMNGRLLARLEQNKVVVAMVFKSYLCF